MNRRPKAYESSALPLSYPGLPILARHLHSQPSSLSTDVFYRFLVRLQPLATLSHKKTTRERTSVPSQLHGGASGRYYARWTISGKQKSVKLKTDVFTVAKLHLPPEAAKVESCAVVASLLRTAKGRHHKAALNRAGFLRPTGDGTLQAELRSTTLLTNFAVTY